MRPWLLLLAVWLTVAAYALFCLFRFLYRRNLRRGARWVCTCLSQQPEPCVWWLDFGTLLGVVREGDVIVGDGDVDVCLLMPDRHGPETARILALISDRLEPHGQGTF